MSDHHGRGAPSIVDEPMLKSVTSTTFNDSGMIDLPQNPCAFEIAAQLTPHSEILELTTEVISGKKESNADGSKFKIYKSVRNAKRPWMLYLGSE